MGNSSVRGQGGDARSSQAPRVDRSLDDRRALRLVERPRCAGHKNTAMASTPELPHSGPDAHYVVRSLVQPQASPFRGVT